MEAFDVSLAKHLQYQHTCYLLLKESDPEAIGHPEWDTPTIEKSFKCISSFIIHEIGLQANSPSFKQKFIQSVKLSAFPGGTVKEYIVCAPLK